MYIFQEEELSKEQIIKEIEAGCYFTHKEGGYAYPHTKDWKEGEVLIKTVYGSFWMDKKEFDNWYYSLKVNK